MNINQLSPSEVSAIKGRYANNNITHARFSEAIDQPLINNWPKVQLLKCPSNKPKAKAAVPIETKGVKLIEREVKIIYLVGENHYSSEECAVYQRKTFELAAGKKLIYAMEGLERDTLAEKEYRDLYEAKGMKGMSSGYLYGFEDPFFNLFNTALDLNFMLRDVFKQNVNSNNQLMIIINEKKNDLLCPLVSKTNQQFLSVFWACETLQGNPIFTFLVKFKEQLIEKSFAVQARFFLRQIPNWANLDWLHFTREISLILSKQVKSLLPSDKHKTLEDLIMNLKEFNPYSNYTQTQEELEWFMTKLHLVLRNPFIANNLQSIHVLTKHLNKPFVSILGDQHIPGITQALRDGGFTVLGARELNERLK